MEKVLFEEPAKRFKVSLSFIQRLLKRYREEGTIAPKTLGGGPTPQLEPYTEQIHLFLEECNDLTLEQLGQKLAQETGVQVSLSTICRFLQKHKKPIYASVKAQTREALEAAICTNIDRVSSIDLRHWFTHCCYCN